MPVIEITDPEDPRLADYLRLRDSSLRQRLEGERGLFIAEGEKIIRRALAAGYRPKSLLLAPRWLAGLSEVLDPQVPVYLVSEALAEVVTGFHVHRGALAACYREERHTLAELLSKRRLVVVEDVVDHANLGAIIRNAAGLGWDGVVLSPRSADPFYRRAIKVAMGTVFTVPWVRATDWAGLLPTLRAAGFTVAGLALTDSAVPLAEFADNPPDRLAIVLGTEGHGLSSTWLAQTDVQVVIPMRPGVDSLNVAAASAIAGYALA